MRLDPQPRRVSSTQSSAPSCAFKDSLRGVAEILEGIGVGADKGRSPASVIARTSRPPVSSPRPTCAMNPPGAQPTRRRARGRISDRVDHQLEAARCVALRWSRTRDALSVAGAHRVRFATSIVVTPCARSASAAASQWPRRRITSARCLQCFGCRASSARRTPCQLTGQRLGKRGLAQRDAIRHLDHVAVRHRHSTGERPFARRHRYDLPRRADIGRDPMCKPCKCRKRPAD